MAYFIDGNGNIQQFGTDQFDYGRDQLGPLNSPSGGGMDPGSPFYVGGDYVTGGEGPIDLTLPYSRESTSSEDDAKKKGLFGIPGLGLGSISEILQALSLVSSLFADSSSPNLAAFGGENAVPFTGQAALPSYQPGATQSMDFLGWQPGRPLDQPSEMVSHNFFPGFSPGPVSGGLDANLGQALAALLAALGGGQGAPAAGAAREPSRGLSDFISQIQSGRGGRWAAADKNLAPSDRQYY